MGEHIVLSDFTIQIDANEAKKAQAKVKKRLQELGDEEDVDKIQIDRLKTLPP